jgi:hypothetical protein
MIRTAVLFATVAVALAGDRTNSCPPNSKLTNPPYKNMLSCTCDAPYEAYTFPGWGCYHPEDVFSCPNHSTERDAQATPHSMEDCRCDEGFASYKKDNKYECVYAYVFHLHGRVWLNPYTKANFALNEEEAFRTAMAGVLTHPDLDADEQITKEDVLPYSIHETNTLAADITNEELDHHKIILAESDYTSEAKELATSTGGVAVGFAIKLRSDSMTYGNKLVQSMKKQSLAEDLLAALKSGSTLFASTTSAHVFVWALTAEFWRSATTTSAPYTWAPTRASTAGITRPPNTTPPSPAPTLAPNQKATVDMALTISCDCHLHGLVKTDHLMCMLDEGYLSMYRFAGTERAAFTVAMAKTLGTTAPLVEIKAGGVSPAGLHPHTAETFSPVHADPFANGIEVHFRVAVSNIAEAKSIQDKFDASATNNFSERLADNLLAEAWNVPKGCIMYNTVGEGANKAPLPAALKTYHWEAATHAPTPEPTLAPLDTPGRRPSCVDGAVIAVRGSARFISPVALGHGLDTPGRRTAENDFMTKTRNIIADKITNGWTNADSTTTAGSGITIKGCDILVAEGTWKHQQIQIYVADSPVNGNGRRLAGGIGDNPNKALKARRDQDGYIEIYSFVFSVNVPNQNMHDGNAVFDFMHNNVDFVKNVNFDLADTNGREIAPKYVQGSKYRPSAPIFSELDVSEIELVYVAPEATFPPTPAPEVKNIDCVVEWSEKTACDATCGGGVEKQFGLIVTAAEGTGTPCPTTLVREHAGCAPKACPTDCKMNPWKWTCAAGVSDEDCLARQGDCSETCGGGHKTKTRTVHTQPSVGTDDQEAGQPCPYDEDTATTCNNQPCPKDCVLSEWGSYGDCSKKCNTDPDNADNSGAGKKYRRRSILSLAYYGGAECESLVDEEVCNVQACPTDCVVSAWSEWGSCSKNCAGQTPGKRLFGARQERSRYIETPAANGGHQCPTLAQTKLCALHPCGANVCTTTTGFPLTCTYENDIVYTHHVNDVHDNELFMCYHNYVTEVCTCLCWPKTLVKEHGGVHRDSTDKDGNAQDNLLHHATSSVENFPEV